MFFIFVAGVALLLGRYDWGAAFPYAIRGYLPSFFFFTLLFVFLKNLFEEIRVSKKRTFLFLTLFVVIFCFPDRWLGLHKFYIHERMEVLFDWLADKRLPRPVLEFFPEGLRFLGEIPYEGLLIALIWALFYFIAHTLTNERREKVFIFSLFTLMLLELWIHLGLRSPYSYMPHFEKDENYWYHSALFMNGRGAVNGDYPWFRQGEQTFIGIEAPLAPLWDRLFPAFLSATFSRYLHPYHVGIFMNALFWALGTLALYRLGKNLAKEKGEVVGAVAAFLMATSQGFLVYVGQPMPYVTAYSLLAIFLNFYFSFFIGKTPSVRQTFLTGLLLGLLALSYDVQPWWLIFALSPFVLKTDKKRTFQMLGLSLGIYLVFHNLWRILPEITYHSAMVDPNLNPLGEIFKVLARLNPFEWALLSWATLSGWVTFCLRAFLGWFIVAVLALWKATLDVRNRSFLLLLFLPAFLGYAIMQWSKTEYYLQFPRIVFSSYPAIYILAGCLAAKFWEKGKSFQWGIAALLFSHFIYVNLDTFGFPYIYLHWFYRGSTLHQVFWHVSQ